MYSPRRPRCGPPTSTAPTRWKPRSWCARPGWTGWCCGWAASLTAEPRFNLDLDTIYFEASLPIDGRIQTVDVRDVAHAFVAATTAPVIGETLLIGGDDSHRLVQGDLAPSIAAAMGLVGGIPAGRKGNPDSDADWFGTDWMDTTRSVEALNFQRISWPQLLAETADRMGWLRHPARLAAPLAHALLKRRSPYYRYPGRYADPWGVIDAKWPDPRSDGGPRMTNRTAVIVGGASGIGKAVAHALAADGCRVIVADRNGGGARSVATELGDPHTAATVEVTDEDSVRALFDHAGALDVVVNTAGYSALGLITELPAEDFRSVVDVCLTGAFLVIKHAAPRLSKGGALVSISSLNGRQPAAAMSAYCAAKAG